MNEKRLAAALKNDKAKALEKIIDIYSGYVCTVVRNFSRGTLSEDDIDEISVDVFYSLWKKRHSIDAEIGLRPYLSACARNAVKNRFRASDIPADSIDEEDIISVLSVEKASELKDAMRCLNEGIGQLADDEREIFFRFYFYGERSAKIAERMGIPDSTVRTKLRRTRAKLKEYMKERGFENV